MHVKLLEGQNRFFSLSSRCLPCSQNKWLGISGKNRSRGREGHKQGRGQVQVVVKHHEASPCSGGAGRQFSELGSNTQPAAGWISSIYHCLPSACLLDRQLLELGWSASFPWIFFLALVYPTAFILPTLASPTLILSELHLGSRSQSKLWMLALLRIEYDCGSESISYITRYHFPKCVPRIFNQYYVEKRIL